MPINRKKLYKLFMELMSQTAKNNPDHNIDFDFEGIVNSIADIIDEHSDLILNPIHKFNNADGATLCHKCRTIIAVGLTDDIFCNKCKEDFQIK